MLHYIFCLAPLFVCLFWAVIFLITGTHNKPSKLILGLFMAACALKFTTHMVYYSGDKLLYAYFDDIYVFISLLIFPLYFLYLISIIRENIFKNKYFGHFAPAFIFLIGYIILSAQLSDKEYESYILNFIHSKDIIYLDFSNPIHHLGIWLVLSRIYYILQILFYVIYGLSLYKKWKERIRGSLSETTGREIRFIKTLSVVGIFLFFVSFMFDFTGRFFLPENSLILLIPALVFAPFFFTMGMIGYEQNFSIADLVTVEQKAELVENAIRHENPSKIRQGLEILMNEKKIFLTPDLKISTVCEKLHTNRTYLSQVLNEELKENFNSYINKFRVEHAISLFKDPTWSNYSLDRFAELSGFGSTISMIRAFKQITGKTPKEFRV